MLLLITASAYSQTDTLSQSDFEKHLKPWITIVQSLNKENIRLKSEIADISNKLNNSIETLAKLDIQVKQNAEQQFEATKKLGLEIQEKTQNNEGKILKVRKSVSTNFLFGVIAFLSAIILSIAVYVFLRKTQKIDKSELIKQLTSTKLSIEESLVKEFGKQTDLLDSQLQILEQQKTNGQASASLEPDHSFALKVASEINLIERNVNLMDTGTKGLKQLIRSIGKLKDNLAANGYEMPDLLGKPYNPGMIVIVASSIPDENLEKGTEKITKVMIPQVNYNGKMIQTANIEVTVGL